MLIPTDDEYGNWKIGCGHCGHECTHIHRVLAYARKEDDAAIVTTVTMPDFGTVVTDGDALPPNPSRRREGVRIETSCERCQHITSLVVLQHKGTNYVVEA